MECSGEKKWLLPSKCDRKLTPSSVTLRRLLSEKTWKPPGPTDEAVQAAKTADELVAGAQIEVIGVAEDDFRAERFQRVLRDGLDRAGGAYRHEDRGLYGAVGQIKASTAPAGLGGCKDFES
jgi:hypothetical protein